MTARELRIGNLILSHINERQKEYMSDEYIYVVTEIKDMKVNANIVEGYAMNIYKSTHLPYHKISPIPITEDWLLAFGFEKVGDNIFEITIEGFGGRKISFTKITSEWGLGLNFNDGDVTKIFPTNIYHIHQLQNLYCALTGEDLAITETAQSL